MSKVQKQRLLRDFHNKSPGPFNVFNQKVVKGVIENQSNPILAAHAELISSYLATSAKHVDVYHRSTYGSILDISERDILQQQLVNYLDEIASLFEMAAVRNPEVLLTSGFNIAKERRGRTRTKQVATASEAPADGANSNNG